MLIDFHVASGKDREEGLALSLTDGLKQFGDEVRTWPTADFIRPDPAADIGAVFGLKGRSHEILEAYRDAGKRTLLFDKALIRVPGAPSKHLRICIDGDSPLNYLMRVPRSFERWEALRIVLQPPRSAHHRDAIILALSSQKYCTFHGLGDATDYAKSIVAEIRKTNYKRQIIYRPKPSWHDFKLIEGTKISRNPEYLAHLLLSAYTLVTHGSSAAVDAIIAGVPAITLGPSAAWPVSGKSLKTINAPYFPSDAARFTWASNLAWCQWSVPELQSGEGWGFIRGELEALSA